MPGSVSSAGYHSAKETQLKSSTEVASTWVYASMYTNILYS